MRIISRRRGPIRDGPPPQRLAEALAKVGRGGLRVSEDRVALVRRGAAITLNGIAQGYATDRVVDMLRKRGPVDDAGQYGRDTRDRSESPTGRRGASASPIRTGPARSPKPSTSSIVRSRPSAGAGFRFDPAGRFTHLFDPATGRSPALLSHGERHRADRHRSGCAFDRVQPDAAVADRRHRGRAAGRAGPASSPPAETLIVYGA